MNTSEAADSFCHVESELAETLGLAQSVLKAQRASLPLVRGTDWQLVRNRVCYTREAREKILSGLQVVSLPAAAGPEKSAIGGPAASLAPLEQFRPDLAALVCVKLPRNRRILLARLAGGAPHALVRVRVKDSGKFTPGMELQARHLAADLYQFEGHAPRWTGKY